MMNDNKDFEVTSPPTDGISSLHFSPTAELLACTSWDNQLRVWEVQQSGGTVPKCGVPHDAPLLCSAWSQDGLKLFAGGASKSGGKLLDVNTGQHINYAQHDAPISCCDFVDVGSMNNVLVTGSWDKTLKYWDARTPNVIQVVNLPERCYVMAASSPLLVVGTAERHLLIYDLKNPVAVYKQMTSPLKHQTRSLGIFATKNGFAVGSIEGRVAIQYVEEKDSSNNFSFKCHRDNNNVYAVNAISFHPQYGTFSTAGADGTFSFWYVSTREFVVIL
jgi:mRNA export factor